MLTLRDLASGGSRLSGSAHAWPLVRTFRSARFRVLVAGSLWAAGAVVIGWLLVRQAGDPAGQFGIDFADYRSASLRMLEGGSPYAPEMLAEPVPAHGLDRYRYPPPFAQVITPLALLPLGAGATLWLGIQALLILLALWLAARRGGVRPRLEHVLWMGAAATCFLPVFDALWKGNVDGPLALLVVLAVPAGVGSGVAVAAATWLKVSPIALVPGVLRGGRAAGLGLLLGSALIAVPSFILAPGAWTDYARVLPNLVAGPAADRANLAPASLLAFAGAAPILVDAVRVATLAVAIAAVLTAVWLAGRPGGWPASVAAGVIAMLLLPATIWYHYLVVLLPLAVLAWPMAGRGARTGLLAGGAAIALGVAALPLADLGAVLMAGSTLRVLWPRGATG